jgi:hypothetical protein
MLLAQPWWNADQGYAGPAVKLALSVLVALALAFTGGVASASKLPRPHKPKGAYKVVVTGTGTLELNLASAPWACGGQAENLLLLKGVYRSDLATKTATIPRARSWTRKKPYGPYGTVAPLTVSGTSEETFNDYTACPPLIGSGSPVTKTCSGSATRTLSRSTHQLRIYRDIKGIHVSLQTSKGDRRTDGFPGPVNSCALGISEQHPIEIDKRVPNSRFAGRKGTLVLTRSAPVAFERPYGFHPPISYTGTATYQLTIQWLRTSKGAQGKAKK